MTVRQVPDGELRTVVEVLRGAATLNPDVEAYVEPAHQGPGGPVPRRSLTFGALDRAADGVAGLLEAHGVGHGHVVGLVLPSSIDYAVCYAAALRLGAITSGINPRLGPAEVTSIVQRARPTVTVVDPALGVDLPAQVGRVIHRGEAAAAWDGPPPTRLPTLAPGDPVAVVWTSGTTGRPKGAVFDHRCLAAVSAGADVLSRPGDRRLSPLPFAHVGYMTKVWDELAHGITTVITPTPWRADQALRVMVEEAVTVAQGVPTQWALILGLAELDAADLSSLRIAGTGAAPMPATQVAELRRRLGVPVVVRYASTETAVCTGTDPGDPDHVVASTVGRPVTGVELSVVDDQERPVDPGSPGRVRIRSNATFRGYWRDRTAPGAVDQVVDTQATAAVRSPQGWVRTGDYGVLDGEGNLRLVGRESERYIRGGYNVYPSEVEDVLASCPGVARAAVVGAPDNVLGEVGVAFVEAADADRAPGLEELRAFCAGRLADYKAPDAMVVVDRLPLTPMMKVDKRSLAAAARSAAQGRRSGRPVASTPTPARPGKEHR